MNKSDKDDFLAVVGTGTLIVLIILAFTLGIGGCVYLCNCASQTTQTNNLSK